MNNIKVAVLICSCDYYSDCWEPIIYSFDKYWPDCEYPKYIVANHKKANLHNTVVINVGDHKGWGADTNRAIQEIDCDYLIYFQEDYFLAQKVDNDAIKAHISYMHERELDYLKISYDGINCDKHRIDDSDYCINPINRKYSVNTAVAVWKKCLLEKLAIPGYTGWDFEYKILDFIQENKIAIKSETLLSTIIPLKGLTMIPGFAVQRGKWTPAGVEFLKANGFEELLKTRKIQNKFYSCCYLYLPSKGVFKYPYRLILRILRHFGIN